MTSAVLRSDTEFLACPVCKNGISEKSIVPLYTKEEGSKSEIPTKKNRPESVPPRPTPQRQAPERNNNSLSQNTGVINRGGAMNLQAGVIIAGFGYFPSLFNLLLQVGNKIDDSDMDKRFFTYLSKSFNIQIEQQSPEVAHQPKMRRFFLLVLLLGIIVLLCV